MHQSFQLTYFAWQTSGIGCTDQTGGQVILISGTNTRILSLPVLLLGHLRMGEATSLAFLGVSTMCSMKTPLLPVSHIKQSAGVQPSPTVSSVAVRLLTSSLRPITLLEPSNPEITPGDMSPVTSVLGDRCNSFHLRKGAKGNTSVKVARLLTAHLRWQHPADFWTPTQERLLQEQKEKKTHK
ncbi:uncharacterized protein LOC143934323 [Lithobates pipiens]